MRIAFVNDTDGRENIGCRLTSGRMKTVLAKAAVEIGLNMELRSCPWLFRRHPTVYAPQFIRALTFGPSVISHPVLRELSVIEYGASSVAEVEAADAVIYQPEGSISNDHDALRILRQLCLPLHAALNANKPLGIINGTFPLFTDHRRGLIGTLIDLAEMTYLRDAISALHYGCDFGPDAAVTWPGEAIKEAEPHNYVLITTAAHAAPAADLELALASLAFCRRHSLRPLIMTKACERLNSLRREVAMLGGQFADQVSLSQADALLGRCRLHVGGRYHMALFCATKGIPSYLVISNTHKNRWLAESFHGISILDQDLMDPLEVIDPQNLTAPEIMRRDVARYSKQSYACARSLIEALAQTAQFRSANQLADYPSTDLDNQITPAWTKVQGDMRVSYLKAMTKAGWRTLKHHTADQGRKVKNENCLRH